MDGNTFALPSMQHGDQSMNDNAETIAPEVRDNVAKLPQRVPVSAGAFPKAIVPSNMDEAWRIAKMVVASGLAPRDVQSPERAMVAIMTGLELGLPPMTAIQRIAVINGRPCVWGDAVPALAQRTGMLEAWDEGITGEGDDMVAYCNVTRRINSEGTITKTATFSVADAKKACLWTTEEKVTRIGKNGQPYVKDNDSPWFRFPKRMLQMRARVAFRDLFADAMCGLYIAEEMVGRGSDAEMRDVTPPAQPVIHNPLQDDAEVTAVTAVDNEAEMEVVPPEQSPDRRTETSPPGATGGKKPKGCASVEQERECKEPVSWVDGVPYCDKCGFYRDSLHHVAETPPEPVEPPRQARREPAGEPKPEPAPRQPEPEKASPGLNPALSIALEQPWIKKSVADYILYLERWVDAWAKWGQDPLGLRDRFSAERTIRNGLAEKMTDKQLAQCKATAAGAFARLGGVPK
jgi:hypothetical protein